MPRSPTKPTATCQVLVRMPPELLTRLNELAKAASETRNAAIVRFLSEAVRVAS